MLVSAAFLADVVVPFPSFAEYFGPVSRIPAVNGHWIKQTPKSSSGPGRVCLVSSPAYLRPIGRARGASPFWAQKKLFSARKKKKSSPFRAAKRFFAI